MNDYEKLKTQVTDCGECLKSFLADVAIKQPELEEHAGIIRNHLEALRCELDVLAARIHP